MYGSIVIISRSGLDSKRYNLLKSKCSFGRSQECDIRIQLPEASKIHCEVKVDQLGQVHLANLASNNYTLINGNILSGLKSLKLYQSDIFSVGGRDFRWEYPSDSKYISKTPKENKKKCASDPDENEEKKAVSFGPYLSPEHFDLTLPPSTPVKKGEQPKSESFSCSPAPRNLSKHFSTPHVTKNINNSVLRSAKVSKIQLNTVKSIERMISLNSARKESLKTSKISDTKRNTTPLNLTNSLKNVKKSVNKEVNSSKTVPLGKRSRTPTKLSEKALKAKSISGVLSRNSKSLESTSVPKIKITKASSVESKPDVGISRRNSKNLLPSIMYENVLATNKVARKNWKDLLGMAKNSPANKSTNVSSRNMLIVLKSPTDTLEKKSPSPKVVSTSRRLSKIPVPVTSKHLSRCDSTPLKSDTLKTKQSPLTITPSPKVRPSTPKVRVATPYFSTSLMVSKSPKIRQAATLKDSLTPSKSSNTPKIRSNTPKAKSSSKVQKSKKNSPKPVPNILIVVKGNKSVDNENYKKGLKRRISDAPLISSKRFKASVSAEKGIVKPKSVKKTLTRPKSFAEALKSGKPQANFISSIPKRLTEKNKTTKRSLNTNLKPKTPLPQRFGVFSTGHANSPAPIILRKKLAKTPMTTVYKKGSKALYSVKKGAKTPNFEGLKKLLSPEKNKSPISPKLKKSDAKAPIVYGEKISSNKAPKSRKPRSTELSSLFDCRGSPKKSRKRAVSLNNIATGSSASNKATRKSVGNLSSCSYEKALFKKISPEKYSTNVAKSLTSKSMIIVQRGVKRKMETPTSVPKAKIAKTVPLSSEKSKRTPSSTKLKAPLKRKTRSLNKSSGGTISLKKKTPKIHNTSLDLSEIGKMFSTPNQITTVSKRLKMPATSENKKHTESPKILDLELLFPTLQNVVAQSSIDFKRKATPVSIQALGFSPADILKNTPRSSLKSLDLKGLQMMFDTPESASREKSETRKKSKSSRKSVSVLYVSDKQSPSNSLFSSPQLKSGRILPSGISKSVTKSGNKNLTASKSRLVKGSRSLGAAAVKGTQSSLKFCRSFTKSPEIDKKTENVLSAKKLHTTISVEKQTLIEKVVKQILELAEKQTPESAKKQTPKILKKRTPKSIKKQSPQSAKMQTPKSEKEIMKKQTPKGVKEQTQKIVKKQTPKIKKTSVSEKKQSPESTKKPTSKSIKNTPQSAKMQTPKSVKKQTPKIEKTPVSERKQSPESTKKQTPQSAKMQTPKSMKKQTPKSVKKQTPKSVKKQTPKIEKTPESEKKQSPESTKKQTLGSTKKQTPKSIKKQTPQSGKMQNPKSVKKQTPKSVKKQTPKIEKTPESEKKHSPESTKKQTLGSTKKQTPKSIKKQTPQSAEMQTPKSVKKQTPKSVKKQTPKIEKTPVSEKKQSPESTKKQTSGSTKNQTLQSAKKQTPKSIKKQTPKSVKKQTPKSEKQTPKVEKTPINEKKQTPESTKKQISRSTKKQISQSAKMQTPKSVEKKTPKNVKKAETPVKRTSASKNLLNVSTKKETLKLISKEIPKVMSATKETIKSNTKRISTGNKKEMSRRSKSTRTPALSMPRLSALFSTPSVLQKSGRKGTRSNSTVSLDSSKLATPVQIENQSPKSTDKILRISHLTQKTPDTPDLENMAALFNTPKSLNKKASVKRLSRSLRKSFSSSALKSLMANDILNKSVDSSIHRTSEVSSGTAARKSLPYTAVRKFSSNPTSFLNEENDMNSLNLTGVRSLLQSPISSVEENRKFANTFITKSGISSANATTISELIHDSSNEVHNTLHNSYDLSHKSFESSQRSPVRIFQELDSNSLTPSTCKMNASLKSPSLSPAAMKSLLVHPTSGSPVSPASPINGRKSRASMRLSPYGTPYSPLRAGRLTTSVSKSVPNSSNLDCTTSNFSSFETPNVTLGNFVSPFCSTAVDSAEIRDKVTRMIQPKAPQDCSLTQSIKKLFRKKSIDLSGIATLFNEEENEREVMTVNKRLNLSKLGSASIKILQSPLKVGRFAKPAVFHEKYINKNASNETCPSESKSPSKSVKKSTRSQKKKTVSPKSPPKTSIKKLTRSQKDKIVSPKPLPVKKKTRSNKTVDEITSPPHKKSSRSKKASVVATVEKSAAKKSKAKKAELLESPPKRATRSKIETVLDSQLVLPKTTKKEVQKQSGRKKKEVINDCQSPVEKKLQTKKDVKTIVSPTKNLRTRSKKAKIELLTPSSPLLKSSRSFKAKKATKNTSPEKVIASAKRVTRTARKINDMVSSASPKTSKQRVQKIAASPIEVKKTTRSAKSKQMVSTVSPKTSKKRVQKVAASPIEVKKTTRSAKSKQMVSTLSPKTSKKRVQKVAASPIEVKKTARSAKSKQDRSALQRQNEQENSSAKKKVVTPPKVSPPKIKTRSKKRLSSNVIATKVKRLTSSRTSIAGKSLKKTPTLKSSLAAANEIKRSKRGVIFVTPSTSEKKGLSKKSPVAKRNLRKSPKIEKLSPKNKSTKRASTSPSIKTTSKSKQAKKTPSKEVKAPTKSKTKPKSPVKAKKTATVKKQTNKTSTKKENSPAVVRTTRSRSAKK